MKKWVKIAVIFMLLATCMWTGRDIFYYVRDGFRAQQTKNELQHIHEASTNQRLGHIKQEENSLVINLAKLREINKNVQGWIHIEGTKIDYPILQGEDNDYYLNHDIYNRESNRGSIFLDYRSNIETEQIVIYGHHMKDSSMFGSLKNYVDYEFYMKNKYIHVQLGEKLTKWEIFSVYVYKPDDNFFKYSFGNLDEKKTYYELITQKGLHNTNETMDANEKLLTLVTCYYTTNDARLIIHAKPVT